MENLEHVIEEEAQRIKPMVCAKVTETDVDEVMQDIRLSFYTAFPRFREESKLSTYAHGIAKRRILDFFRQKYRRKKEIEAIKEHMRQPHRQVIEQAIESGISFLTVREEMVLRLVGEGMNNTEIAEALFITLNTVRGHMKAIYKKLPQYRNRVNLALFSYKFFKEQTDEN